MYFLFLEFRDKEICALLHGLRSIFNGRPSKSNIHITVRGPYVEPLKDADVRPHIDVIKNDVITIGGVGEFDNPDEHVVFLKIRSQNLANIWWKRDYPTGEFGFNPHISLYSGRDKELAGRIKEFLVQENIQLQARSFELTPYVSNQYCLFMPDKKKHFLHLILEGKVKGDILERAQEVMEVNEVRTNH